jgi:hypothetical protein
VPGARCVEVVESARVGYSESLASARGMSGPSFGGRMFTLQDVVPWGRSLDEYRRMFALSDADLTRRILGCADGPASFNAELTALGGRVVSCDPIYRFSTEDIRHRIEQSYETILAETRRNAAEFIWDEGIPDVETLGELRMGAMQRFLADYDEGRTAGRYLEGQLPTLPFEDGAFDLSLCSHFLFLYSEHLPEDFHIQSLRELLRVSREVRVFPLLELGATPSRHLVSAAAKLTEDGHAVSIETVPYEFQRGGNQMMKVVK